jgi:hypothetical protein
MASCLFGYGRGNFFPHEQYKKSMSCDFLQALRQLRSNRGRCRRHAARSCAGIGGNTATYSLIYAPKRNAVPVTAPRQLDRNGKRDMCGAERFSIFTAPSHVAFLETFVRISRWNSDGRRTVPGTMDAIFPNRTTGSQMSGTGLGGSSAG